MTFSLYYIHDPMCSWCYAFNDTFEKLKVNLRENIKIIYVLGGLAPHTDEIMPLKQQKFIQDNWYNIEEKIGLKFNHNFWKECTPKRDTYLACKAVILAKEENKEHEMIKIIQEAYYQNAQNPSDIETLVLLSKKINLKNENFKKNLLDEKTQEKLQKDLNLKNSLYVNSFPSLILKYKKEIYPINIKYNDYRSILNQINNLSENIYF